MAAVNLEMGSTWTRLQTLGFKDRFQQIEESVQTSNIFVRATINDTFTQLMDHLDELETQWTKSCEFPHDR